MFKYFLAIGVIISLLGCESRRCYSYCDAYLNAKITNEPPYSFEKGEDNFIVVGNGKSHSTVSSAHGYLKVFIFKVKSLNDNSEYFPDVIIYNSPNKAVCWGVDPDQDYNIKISVSDLDRNTCKVKFSGEILLREYISTRDAMHRFPADEIKSFKKGRLGTQEVYWLNATKIHRFSAKTRNCSIRSSNHNENGDTFSL